MQGDILTRSVIDTKPMDGLDMYRLSFGMTQADATNEVITVNRFVRWTYRIDIALPGDTTPNWDINEDHDCNMGDITRIGMKWKMTGSAGWIPEDVNKDGVVNIGDIATLGFHWGASW